MARLVPLLATGGALFWALQGNPLAAPFLERTGRDLALSLDRAVMRRATAEWVEAELAAAVAAEDAERAAMLLSLAEEHGHAVDRAAAERLLASGEGWLEGAASCAACMSDPARCPSAAMLGACAVPFELSPLGDVNALRRAGVAWWGGEVVDELEAGLALLGIGATGAALVTGGSSLGVKAGASLLRTARRMGTLTPGLAATLRVPVAWDRVPGLLVGTERLDDVADLTRLRALAGIAADLERVRAATSTGEALRLLRHVEGPADARLLARTAEAVGPRTSRTLEVLGRGRTLRASLRLTRAAAGAMALLALTLAQLGAVIGAWAGGRAARALARGMAAQPIRPSPRPA
jgi:hypothetical protein